MNNLRDFARLHKKESTIVGIIVAIIFVFYFIFFFTVGMRYDETFFTKSFEGDTAFYTGLTDRGKTDISVSASKSGITTVTYQLEGFSKKTYFVTADAVDYNTKKYCSIEIKNENGKEQFSGSFSKGYLFDKNGEPVDDWRSKFKSSTGIEYSDSGEALTATVITHIALYKYDMIRGNPAFLAQALLLFLIAILHSMFPLAIFSMLRHMIRVEDPQPSNQYLTVQKAVWSIIPVVGLAFLINAIILV
nr:hypothetical protein [uncultured Caproiciproducens sp.]